jgi:hypothetical protein
MFSLLKFIEKGMLDVQTITFVSDAGIPQTGPFYSTEVPIELIRITGSKLLEKDPFAIR